MPKELERKLMAIAAKKAKSGKLRRKSGETVEEAKDRYVYGTMRKTGWKPRRETR